MTSLRCTFLTRNIATTPVRGQEHCKQIVLLHVRSSGVSGHCCAVPLGHQLPICLSHPVTLVCDCSGGPLWCRQIKTYLTLLSRLRVSPYHNVTGAVTLWHLGQ